MSLGPVMLDLEGVDITPEEHEILSHPLVGGIILFSRNFASVEQLENLVQRLHDVRSPRLLIAVDHDLERGSKDFITSVQKLKSTLIYLDETSRMINEDPSILIRGTELEDVPDDDLDR